MMNYRKLKWRVSYSLASPYFRPNRLVATAFGHSKAPDFLILGVMRGGTTSLYAYLAKTPGFRPPLRKEIRYFDWNYQKGKTWYVSHFPTRESAKFLTGEASPNYIFFPEVAQRVSHDLPDAKFIAMLRNPIDRAYSHYWHEVALGDEHQPFESALRREVAWEPDGAITQLKDLRENGEYEYDHFTYISRGLYAQQVKPWLENVPRDRFLILKSEYFFNYPDKAFSQVTEFLGLPPTDRTSFPTYNEGQYAPMDEKLRIMLRRFYEPHNNELSRLTGIDVNDWNQ